MKGKRSLLVAWLVVSALWIAFAVTKLDLSAGGAGDHGEPEAQDDRTVEHIVDVGTLLFGVPLALLGTGAAIGWIVKGTRRWTDGE